ncbi:tetratricopeptide repeat protein [Novosphingobium profundi]|uniref:tetratricopeptide repeat protein n=1 Tax=Novosphingobium profundi TaxID=1774954 RepID=UPI001CFDD5F4|nr:tetratricopeptide repeat protein [Novosphingobium profundi]
MIWFLLALLVLAAFVLAVVVLKVPVGGREAVAAALLLGVAGYVTQGSPSQPSSPSTVTPGGGEEAAFLVAARGKVTNRTIPPTNRYVVIADGFARNGQTAEAARVLLGAVEENPKDEDAWLAMANALVAHSEGVLTPASLYAFRQAAKADPKAPGPAFFLGLAMAQSGQFGEARELWADLLERTPEEAEWRPVLAAELQRLDAYIKGNAPASAPDSQAEPESRNGTGAEPTAPSRD